MGRKKKDQIEKPVEPMVVQADEISEIEVVKEQEVPKDAEIIDGVIVEGEVEVPEGVVTEEDTPEIDLQLKETTIEGGEEVSLADLDSEEESDNSEEDEEEKVEYNDSQKQLLAQIAEWEKELPKLNKVRRTFTERRIRVIKEQNGLK